MRHPFKTSSTAVKFTSHEADVQAQVEQLVGIRERHVDMRYLALDTVQLTVRPDPRLVVGPIERPLLDPAQIPVPAIDA